MEFQGTGPVAVAKRRAFAELVEACEGDHEMADDLIAAFAEGEPTAADLRAVAAHARDVAADIEAERRKGG